MHGWCSWWFYLPASQPRRSPKTKRCEFTTAQIRNGGGTLLTRSRIRIAGYFRSHRCQVPLHQKTNSATPLPLPAVPPRLHHRQRQDNRPSRSPQLQRILQRKHPPNASSLDSHVPLDDLREHSIQLPRHRQRPNTADELILQRLRRPRRPSTGRVWRAASSFGAFVVALGELYGGLERRVRGSAV